MERLGSGFGGVVTPVSYRWGVIASSEDVKDWLLIGGTFVLALFTLLLWISTRSMAKATAVAARSASEAAVASSRSTEVAAAGLALESERWSVEMDERRRVHARWVEVDLNPVAGAARARMRATNRGVMSVTDVAFHLWVAGARWDSAGGGHCGPGETLEVMFDLLTPLTDIGSAQACATFTDMDQRRWIRWATDDALVPYDGNPSRLFEDRRR